MFVRLPLAMVARLVGFLRELRRRQVLFLRPCFFSLLQGGRLHSAPSLEVVVAVMMMALNDGGFRSSCSTVSYERRCSCGNMDGLQPYEVL